MRFAVRNDLQLSFAQVSLCVEGMAPSFIQLGAAAAVLLGLFGYYPESRGGHVGVLSSRILSPITFASATDEIDEEGEASGKEAKLEGSSSDSDDANSSLIPSKVLRGSRNKASKGKAKERSELSFDDMKSLQDHLGSILGPGLVSFPQFCL